MPLRNERSKPRQQRCLPGCGFNSSSHGVDANAIGRAAGVRGIDILLVQLYEYAGPASRGLAH
jgi:hypothetical protein